VSDVVVRGLILAGILVAALPSRQSEACEYTLDETYVLGDARPLPAHPSLFVHLGRDSTPGLPTFAHLDGTPIPYHLSVANVPGLLLWRVDLDIAAGAIEIRIPNGAEPSKIVRVDPDLKPHTRVIDVIQTGSDGTPWRFPWVEADTDAELLRVEQGDGKNYTVWLPPNETRGDFTTFGRGARITALYPDGTEALIFDYRPPHPNNDKSPLGPLALLSLWLNARRLLRIEIIERAGMSQ
jgi:hypothetical protein